jgi:hypothetical protein
MTRMAPAVLFALIPFCLATQDNPLTTPKPAIFSLHEISMDLSSHGITANSCIMVAPDGTFHIERRLQQLPQDYAVLHIYESTLDAFQMRRLNNLLDDQSIRDLSRYIPPKTPMAASAFLSVGVRIPREKELQETGYFMWDERTAQANQSPESTPTIIKDQWRATRTTLLPLVQWVHEVEGMKWPEVPESHSNLCDVDSTT